MSERNDMNLTPEELRLQQAVRGLGEVRPDDSFRDRLRAELMVSEETIKQLVAANKLVLERVDADTATQVARQVRNQE